MHCIDSCKNIKDACFTIFKYDSRTGKGLSGAVFQLKSTDGCIFKGTTDFKGCLTFQVKQGTTYKLREVKPPVGYTLIEHIFKISVKDCGCIFVDGILTERLDIKNNRITGSFTAIKVNLENDNPLPGALYTLYLDGVPISSVYSNELGQITFANLLPGKYNLSETQPPSGFQSNPNNLPVVVAPDGNVTILGEPADGFRLINVPLMAFIFQKLDAQTLQPLGGAEFQLSQNGIIINTVVSAPDGKVDFGILMPGTYELTETVTPPDFLPNEKTYVVVVGTDGSITIDNIALDNFVVENVRTPGFSFIKTSSVTSLPLVGAVFELRQNDLLIGTSISDMMGFVSFSALTPGIYQLSETIPPEGYINNTAIYQVMVLNNGVVTIDGLPAQDFSVENEQTVFQVQKTDEVGQPLSGATYELRLFGVAIQTMTSGLDGLMTFSNISPGTYTLVETEAPDGFILNTTVNTVNVSDLGEITINCITTTLLTVNNQPLPPEPRVLGWMRSSEMVGFVPGARIPNIPPSDGVFNGWDFPWSRSHTFMQYFENDEILAAAISGDYTQEAFGVSETLFESSGRLVDETFVWDGGSDHQFFTGYLNGPVSGGWASWSNLSVPESLLSPQTQLPVPGGYTPYHYSLRRFTAYVDVDLSRYMVDAAFLVSQFPKSSTGEFVFPLNDSIFVFVNGILAYWTSTDLIGSGNIAQNRLIFNGLTGIFMAQDPIYDFTDGWYLTLGGASRIADIAPYLRNGKNVIDVIADDYYFGGGMSRINTEFLITPYENI